ncbi:hypothetical protein ACFSCV_08785 [Methylopila henanensis]|uniref:Sulphur transport domain-containing protein n=1 Tax=Methylopila henanensis TaxID=873516 RepID=A0ABW4K5X4_9HYPH
MRHVAAGVVVAFAALALPYLVYAALAFKTFGMFAPSGYLPTEALSVAAAGGDLGALWRAPALSLNVTSGELIAAMYEVTVGAVMLAMALGAAFAFNRSRRTACARPTAAGVGGGGVLASIIGAHTALLGCCGGAGAGGILSLAGAGAFAGGLAALGQPLQLLFAVALVADALRGPRGRAAPPSQAQDPIAAARSATTGTVGLGA